MTNALFGELRAILQNTPLDHALLCDVLVRAYEANPVVYEDQWMPYLDQYWTKHNIDYLEVTQDVDLASIRVPESMRISLTANQTPRGSLKGVSRLNVPEGADVDLQALMMVGALDEVREISTAHPAHSRDLATSVSLPSLEVLELKDVFSVNEEDLAMVQDNHPKLKKVRVERYIAPSEVHGIRRHSKSMLLAVVFFAVAMGNVAHMGFRQELMVLFLIVVLAAFIRLMASSRDLFEGFMAYGLAFMFPFSMSNYLGHSGWIEASWSFVGVNLMVTSGLLSYAWPRRVKLEHPPMPQSVRRNKVFTWVSLGLVFACLWLFVAFYDDILAWWGR